MKKTKAEIRKEVLKVDEETPCPMTESGIFLVPGLSDEEQAKWEELVLEGRAVREANQAKHALESKAKYGEKAEWRATWKRRWDIQLAPSAGAVRWLIARQAGLSVKKAAEVSGTTWEEVALSRKRCVDFDRAMMAMRATKRMMMTEMAMSTMEDCLNGEREVNAVAAKSAQWALERLERQTFGEQPRGLTVEGAAGGSGGIVINLIDTSKPYAPPALAEKGDPEEGVEV